MKSVRRAGKAAGSVLDQEDRKVLGQGAVLICGAAVVIVGGAGIVGLAIRFFELAAG